MDIKDNSAVQNKYDKNNPHPEWTNIMRGVNWRKAGNDKEYKENYDKIVWNKNKSKEEECNTSSKENTDNSETTNKSV